MIHGIVCIAFAAQWVWLASFVPSRLFQFGSVWFAVSFGIVGLGYLFREPRVLGKRSDGGFNPVLFFLHLPWHIVAWLSVQLRTIRTRNRSPYAEVVEGLWLGQRPGQLPPNIERIVDLTVEHQGVPSGAEYVVIPTLDGQAPSLERVVEVVEVLSTQPKPTYVHCLAGRGRSTLVAAYLMHQNVVSTVEEAVQFMRAKRDVVSLSSSQLEMLETFLKR